MYYNLFCYITLIATKEAEAVSNPYDLGPVEIGQQLQLTTLNNYSQCFALSAPGNFGKSFWLRSLAYATPTSLEYLSVYVDLNLRAADSVQAFYELIVRRLLITLKTRAIKYPPKLEELYSELAGNAANGFVIARNFLLVWQELFAFWSGKLILLLDEFDQPFQNLPDAVFLHLRALCDNYPTCLSLIVATNLPLLANGRDEQEGVAEFYELFAAAGQLRLQALSQPESDRLVADITAKQHHADLSPLQRAEIFRLAGGHPGLTRLVANYILSTISDLATVAAVTVENEWEQNLRLNGEIQRECKRIWVSLHPTEHHTLLQHLEGISTLAADNPIGTLTERGLLRVDPETGQSQIFARLFEWFVRDQLTATQSNPPQPAQFAARPALTYDPHQEKVISGNGEPGLRLVGNAALLFKYLFMRQSEPWCSKDELITAIWGNGGYSSENLDRLVSDLRQDIGDTDKQIIRTIPRRGLQMVGVAEWHS